MWAAKTTPPTPPHGICENSATNLIRSGNSSARGTVLMMAWRHTPHTTDAAVGSDTEIADSRPPPPNVNHFISHTDMELLCDTNLAYILYMPMSHCKSSRPDRIMRSVGRWSINFARASRVCCSSRFRYMYLHYGGLCMERVEWYIHIYL